MPVRPKTSNFKYDGVNVLNAIRNSASATYQERIPVATQDNIRDIGNAMMQYQSTQNEFLNALVNRIAKVIITSKSYENPLRRFKKGMLEYGETIEEVFVNIAKAHPFDPILAEKTVYKREIPDVSAVFHKMNLQNFYKATISNDQLRQAFLSAEGISDLIARIVDSMYTASEFDEFLTMKQLIVDAANEGKIYPVTIPAATAANAKEIVSTIKSYSNKLEFMSSTYNAMGVLTHSSKNNQILIMDAGFDAIIDVEVLASAFNMSKAEFMGQRVLIDNFGELTGAVAALVDADWFMVFDNFLSFTENYNGEGLYWNYFYHVWKTFSTSPFSNAILFTTQDNSVTGVTITPTTANVPIAGVQQFTAVCTGEGIVPQGVIWTVSGAQPVKSQIDWTGKLLIAPDEMNSSLVVKATSIYNPEVSKTANVNVTGVVSPIESVTVSPATQNVAKGSNAQFTAVVKTVMPAPNGVIWSVTGGTASSITSGGLLAVGAGETSTQLTITATSIVDNTKSGSATVKVTG